MTSKSVGFPKLKSYLDSMKSISWETALNRIGAEGVAQLSASGSSSRVSAAWDYKVTNSDGVYEVSWFNSVDVGATAPLAILIEYGHGTGTGGYVQARPFIKQASANFMSAERIDAIIRRELNRR